MSQNYGTLRSEASQELSSGLLGDLSELTLIAEDFGEEPDSDFATSLMEIGRRIVYQDDCLIRIGSPDAKQIDARMYVLNDLIIVGKYRKSRKKKSKKTMGMSTMGGRTTDKIVFGESSFKTRDDLTDVNDDRGSVRAKEGMNLKLLLWVNLDRSGLQFRDMNKNGVPGIRIIFTTRVLEDDGEDQVLVTNVDQTELFFESEEIMKKFSENIHDVIDSVLERQVQEIENASNYGTLRTGLDGSGTIKAGTVRQLSVMEELDTSSVRSKSTTGTGLRSFATAKKTMKLAAKARGRGGTQGPLSLSDLENKYKVKLTPKAQADQAEFVVSFKQGALGLALSASGTHGVFVGKLEDNGMADVSGVTLGDRVVDIGGEKIADDASWQYCLEIIKSKRQELTSDGKPKPLLIKFARMREVEENIAKQAEEKKQAEVKERVKKAKAKGNLRKWKTKRAAGKSYGTRMQSLNDLADKYKNRGEADRTQNVCDDLLEEVIKQCPSPDGRQCAYVMKEIYDTEKNYVRDLYMLQDSYIKKLKKVKVDASCKEYALVSPSKFCEHGSSVKSCSKMSSKKINLVTAEDIKTIFINIEVITRLNEELMKTLQTGIIKLSDNKEQGEEVGVNELVGVFSPAFLKLMPYYALYSQYASRYAKAIDRLQFLKETNEKFVVELEILEKKKDVKSLNSLLFAPITRLTKYPLLFKTLFKHMTPYVAEQTNQIIRDRKGDIDKLIALVDSLEKTNATVSKIAASVDMKVDEDNKLEILGEVYEELGGVKYIQEFFKPSRKFIDRFEAVSYMEPMAKKTKMRSNKVFLVFNDLLIIGGYSKSAIKQNLEASEKLKGSLKGKERRSVRKSTSRAGKSKSDRTVAKTARGGFLGMGFLGKTNQQPTIKIEYMSEMKKVKVNATPGSSGGKFPAQIYLTSVPRIDDKDETIRKKKRATSMDLRPSVIQLDLFFEDEKSRQDFVSHLNELKEELRQKEESIQDAKATLTNARSALRENRERLQRKAEKHNAGGATLSSNRQADLKAKLMERRKQRTLGKNKGN